MLIVAFLGFTAAMVMVSVTNARATTESTDQVIAFYLAEQGLETAKWELAYDEDPDRNGTGTVTVVTPQGDISVTATERSGMWNLTATGSSGIINTTIQQTVQLVSIGGTASPFAMLGDFGKFPDVSLSHNTSFIIDGGNFPAITIGDPDTYNDFYQVFDVRDIDPNDITGGGLTVYGLDRA